LVYLKQYNKKFFILTLYFNDILRTSNDLQMIGTNKDCLTSNFDMEYMSNASYVFGLNIHKN